MGDIGDLMKIDRKRLVQDSEFDSTFGIDEELYDSMRNELPPNLTMREARQKLHPTVSELWICDTGLGVELPLPYIKGKEVLSRGEELMFPALQPDEILRGAPHKQAFSSNYYRITDALELEGRLTVYGVNGIGTDYVKVRGSEDILGNYFYTIAKFSPDSPDLLELSVGYGQVRDPLLQVDVKRQKTGEYVAGFRECENPQAIPLPDQRVHNIDFYETVRALAKIGVNQERDLSRVIKSI